MTRIVCVVQARMSSRRLPGKVLMEVRGRPMLGYTIDRLRKATAFDCLILATSDRPEDDVVAAFGETEGIQCHRGCLNEVSNRILAAGENADADAIVRISGDSPLIDPRVVDQVTNCYRMNRGLDLVTNVQKRTFPKGQSVEVFSTVAMRRLLGSKLTAHELEHVTLGFYQRSRLFSIKNVINARDLSSVQLSVDTEEDMKQFEALVEYFETDLIHTGFEDLAVACTRIKS